MIDTLADLAIILFVSAIALKYGAQRFAGAQSSKIIGASVTELRELESSAATTAELHWEDDMPKIKMHLKRNRLQVEPNGFNVLKGEYVHYVVDLVTAPHVTELRALEKKFKRISSEQHDELLREHGKHIEMHRSNLIEAGVDIDALNRKILGETAPAA